MARFHLPSIEEERLRHWRDAKVLRRIIDRKDAPAGPFVFFEGPPTANGKPGIHHLLTRAFKDCILRFRTMRGHRIDRKAGWDTHGLPVELEVEKQLGFTRKQQIEEYGIAEFNEKCRESVWKYLDLWRKSTERVAFWIDLDDPYVTYANDFVESLWWILSEIDRRGFLYEGHRTTPHCPRCVTSLSSHELAQGYKDVDDVSVFVKFRFKGEEDRSLLAWTTTPWTLPANMALAVAADVPYVEVRVTGGERLVLARPLLGAIEGDYEEIGEMKGSDLVGAEYEPLYALAPADALGKAYRVYAGGFVSTVDGTGIVHIAPAYGEDDAELGRQEGIPPVMSVDATGVMGADAPGAGMFFKDADAEVMKDLAARGLLYRKATYTHSYPFCWRCGTPLMYYAKGSWYIAMSKLRQEMLAANAMVNWTPSHIRDGRFGEWLRDAKDWALSRERYWGTPLPVWKCGDCGAKRVIGGLEELDAAAPARNVFYLQRHGESESNIKDIISCWPEPGEFPLTEKGRAQIAKVAEEYKKLGIHAIYASDLLRTKQTAEIIAEALGLDVIYDERLRELDVGIYNGKGIEEYNSQFRADVEKYERPVEGGESLRDCRRRMVGFLKEIDAKHEGKRIIVVSHGDPVWLAHAAFRQLSERESFGGVPYNHTGQYTELDLPRRPYDRDGRIDVHRPFIDEVRLVCPAEGCGGRMTRVPDVIDVWFDSGAMPYAQWHYPFENRERIEEPASTNFPAAFISEAIDQTRGWFYTLLAVSTLLGRGTPYENVICLGHVLDANGQKMSKSKGNVVDPFAMIDKHGADAIRYYFFTVNQPGEPKRFDEKGLEEITKKVFMILWNVLAFHKMYAGEEAGRPARPEPSHPLDRWILAELESLAKRVTDGLSSYDIVGPARDVAEFVNGLSTWYVRRSRDRFKNGTDREKADARATLGYVLHSLSRIMAPFTPFLADALYRETGGQEDSVHLDRWPSDLAEAGPDEPVRTAMGWVRMAASAGLEKRAAAGIPVRQALAKASIVAPGVNREEWMAEILKDELNVLEVDWSGGESFTIGLDTEITPELRRMGAARELVRHVNALRKEAKMTPDDRIAVVYAAAGDLWTETLAEHGEAVMRDVRADRMEAGDPGDGAKELEMDGQAVRLAILKA